MSWFWSGRGGWGGPWSGRGGWGGPWPGRGPFSYLPPWQRPGRLYGRGACWWLFNPNMPRYPMYNQSMGYSDYPPFATRYQSRSYNYFQPFMR